MVGVSGLAAFAVFACTYHPPWRQMGAPFLMLGRSFWLIGILDLFSVLSSQYSLWYWLVARLWFVATFLALMLRSSVKKPPKASLLLVVAGIAAYIYYRHSLAFAFLTSSIFNALAHTLIAGTMFSAVIVAAQKEISDLHEQTHRANQLSTLAFFCSQLGHDIRNPLTVIRANAQLGQMRTANTPIANLFDRIIVQTDMATEMVNTKLLINRLCQDDPSIFDMNELVVATVNMWTPEANARLLKLDVSLNNKPVFVKAHRVLLQQALHNLLLNAMQASKAHTHVKLSVESTQSEAILGVHDTGVGISGEVQAKMFSEFFADKQQVAGLGLSVGKWLVDNEGGRVWFTSQLGQGSNFYIALPLDILSSAYA